MYFFKRYRDRLFLSFVHHKVCNKQKQQRCPIDNNIVSTVSSYLSQNFEPSLYALDFTQSDYDGLMMVLTSEYNADLLEHSKGSIKLALKNFFSQTYQLINVKHKGNLIRIEKEFDEPMHDEKYDRVVHRAKLTLLSVNENIDNYRKNNFLLELPEDVKNGVLDVFNEVNEGELRRRDVVRRLMYKVFPIKDKDIILFLRGNIYIREFQPKQKNATPEEGGGVDLKEVEALFQRYFSNGVLGEIELLLPDVLFDKLNFAKIDNNTFIKSFVPTFRSLIDIVISKHTDDAVSDKMQDALGAYILKKHFDDVMYCTAKNLMEFVMERDMNTEQFIKYYEDEVVLKNGKKKKKHPIIDGNGHRWNYSSILSVLMQWKQAKKRLDEVEAELENKKEKALKAQTDIDTAEATLRAIEESKERIGEEIKEINSERQMIKYKENGAKSSEEKNQFKMQIAKLNAQSESLHTRYNSEQAKCNQQINKINNLETEYKNRTKHVENDEEILRTLQEKNKSTLEAYEKIAWALAKTISKP